MAQDVTFEVAQALDIPIDGKEEIINLCSAAYEMDFSHLFETLPGSTHVLAWLNGEMVSHAAWVTRWLQPEGQKLLRTAYVEAVATAPEHRGQGLATAVLKELQIQIRDYQLGALSPSDPAFYERLGWELWQGPLAIRLPNELLPRPDGRVMILRLDSTPQLDLNSPLTAELQTANLW
jgi:aminoglycoside 2'-N-acetyltransferase I